MAEGLRELVVRLADHSTAANQDAFYRDLLAGQVAVPLRVLPSGVQPGTEQVADGQQWTVPTTRGPDGGLLLLVYTDPQAAMQSPGAKAVCGLSGRVVLEMAQANRAGVIVASGYGAAASWAGVPRDHVTALLAVERQSPRPDAPAVPLPE
jgi:hypothetical protein